MSVPRLDPFVSASASRLGKADSNLFSQLRCPYFAFSSKIYLFVKLATVPAALFSTLLSSARIIGSTLVPSCAKASLSRFRRGAPSPQPCFRAPTLRAISLPDPPNTPRERLPHKTSPNLFPTPPNLSTFISKSAQSTRKLCANITTCIITTCLPA